MITDKIKDLPAGEAIEILDRHLADHPNDDEAYYQRGLRLWGLSRRKEAINDYLAALRLNPRSKAKEALDYANSILDFYYKDLLNP